MKQRPLQDEMANRLSSWDEKPHAPANGFPSDGAVDESRRISSGSLSATPICVVGMHRSGTSLLMQMLSICGVAMGEDERIRAPGDQDNPTGYWEHPRFQEINKRLLRRLGGSWKAPPSFPADWKKDPGLLDLRKEALELVERLRGQGVWGWKDPRNSLTIPFWSDLLPGLRFVVIFRNPLQVAMSLHGRLNEGLARSKAGLTFQSALALWGEYYRRILNDLPDKDSCPIAHYETLLYEPAGELRRILDVLRLEMDSGGFERAVQAARSDLFRNRASEALLDSPGLPDVIRSTYEKLATAAGPHCRAMRLDAEYQEALRHEDPAFLQLSAAAGFPTDPLPARRGEKTESLQDVEIVVVHYRHVRPTVVMLNALFRHYPELDVTLMDNSGGLCPADRTVMPHLAEYARQIRVLVNPASEHGPETELSHGGGIDLARRHCTRRYLLTMESDTIVLGRGCIEYALSLMDDGYDWGGVAQKPVGNRFASFSPCFAIFRVDLLNRYDLSFCRRRRTPEERRGEDLLLRHHSQAAERVRRGLPLEYLEGKPPDTYRRSPEEIIAVEVAHLDYFDTAEWVHYVLARKGHRGLLFRCPPTICHIWGSRDESLFLGNFREKLPCLDPDDFLPPTLATQLSMVPLECLALVQGDARTPAQHWIWTGGKAGRLATDAGGLEVELDVEESEKVYLAMGEGSFAKPPAEALNARLAAGTAHSLRCTWRAPASLEGRLWIIEYAGGTRIQHHNLTLKNGANALEFVTGPATDRFRVLFRFSGTGRATIRDLNLSAALQSRERGHSVVTASAHIQT